MDELETFAQEQEESYHAWRSVIEPQPYPKVEGHAKLTALEEVNPYSKFALGKDISHYDELDKDDPQVKGVDFLVVKMGGSENAPYYGNPYTDDKFNRYVQLAWDLDVPLIVYWMCGARVYQDNGMTELNLHQCNEHTHPVFSDTMDGGILKAWHNGLAWKQIKEFFFDYEEPCYWMTPPYTIDEYWAKLYHEELRGNRLVHKMNSNAPDEKYPFPTIPIGLYSRRSFMDQHYNGGKNPYSLWDWLIQHPELSTWAANYPRKVPNTATVEEVRASWLPLATWKPYSLRDDGSWTYWQFAGDPDWDLYNGTKEELYARLKYTSHGPVTPPEPEPEPVEIITYATTTRPVNMRSDPSVSHAAIALLPTGTKLEVVGTQNVGTDVWRKVHFECWVADHVGTTNYLTITEEPKP